MTTKRILNIVFWVSLSLIGFWLICIFMVLGLNLEFYNTGIKMGFYSISFFLLPISVMMLIVRPINSKQAFILPLRILLFFCLAMGSIVLQISFLFSNLCEYTNIEVLYERNYNPAQKIMLRTYSCEDYSENDYSPNPYKITFIPPFFAISTPIDTANINPGKWRKITDN